ncbi:trypsin-like peptidase domain-containing protein [Sulfuricurvum sp.]|uniref:trypsin-like peptidase domain-containing protein n=1 Tax=Sulfuricurvum sp. TaxID=2025608 RepID=UPI001994FC82|nr:trypsin-like peptidase domain-containing protein [Sulfuricurvum sp.]MBD3798599.1 trypsin-like peptidase domain-containing protein [Campylobacterota bacterium]MBD3805859.1 trypsin-like peptidase domain-containing protein [Sulfuricurvum sp.]
MNTATQKMVEQTIESIVQITNPYGSGSGFIIDNLIITNSHVANGLKEALISTKTLTKTIASVIYDDPAYDLAFIRSPIPIKCTSPLLLSSSPVQDGDSVIAIGHPYGLNYSTTEGIVSKASRFQGEVEYIQFDAAINPGNSGGPLLNDSAEVVGVNTFIIQNSNNLGFALPSYTLKEALDQFYTLGTENVIRCSSCKNLIKEVSIQNDYCPKCGTKLEVAKRRREGYKPSGNVALIEKILHSLHVNVPLARRSQRSWRFEIGTTRIDINYYDNGIIIADSALCRIPSEKIESLYDFLLNENSTLERLQFSINENTVYLSYIVVDSSLNETYGTWALRKLFDKAPHYQKLLIDNFKAPEPKFDEFE